MLFTTFLFLLPDQRLYTVMKLCIDAHTHTHISDCVETVYGLALLQIILQVNIFTQIKSSAKCLLDIYH